MSTFFYYLAQYTWALPLNLIGAVVAFVCRHQPHFSYGLARVSYWNRRSSMAIGRFIFLEKNLGPEEPRILMHEYGHTFQSAYLGPIYLPAIALPSVIWANSKRCVQYRKSTGRSYYSFYPERWADAEGMKHTKERI